MNEVTVAEEVLPARPNGYADLPPDVQGWTGPVHVTASPRTAVDPGVDAGLSEPLRPRDLAGRLIREDNS